ncbi:MAG TPA: hypothetical protein VGH44_00675 [Candidatus Saccharimonadia bacterium]
MELKALTYFDQKWIWLEQQWLRLAKCMRTYSDQPAEYLAAAAIAFGQSGPGQAVALRRIIAVYIDKLLDQAFARYPAQTREDLETELWADGIAGNIRSYKAKLEAAGITWPPPPGNETGIDEELTALKRNLLTLAWMLTFNHEHPEPFLNRLSRIAREDGSIMPVILHR